MRGLLVLESSPLLHSTPLLFYTLNVCMALKGYNTYCFVSFPLSLTLLQTVRVCITAKIISIGVLWAVGHGVLGIDGGGGTNGGVDVLRFIG